MTQNHFQETLSNLEESPPNRVWSKIWVWSKILSININNQILPLGAVHNFLLIFFILNEILLT